MTATLICMLLLLLCPYKSALRIEVIQTKLSLHIKPKSGSQFWIGHHTTLDSESVTTLCPGFKRLLRIVYNTLEQDSLGCKDIWMNNTKEDIAGVVALYHYQYYARITSESNWRGHFENTVKPLFDQWFDTHTSRGVERSEVGILEVKQVPMEYIELNGDLLISFDEKTASEWIADEIEHAYGPTESIVIYDINVDGLHAVIKLLLKYDALIKYNMHLGGPTRHELLLEVFKNNRVLPEVRALPEEVTINEDPLSPIWRSSKVRTCEGEANERISLGAGFTIIVKSYETKSPNESTILRKAMADFPSIPCVDIIILGKPFCDTSKECHTEVIVYVEVNSWFHGSHPAVQFGDWIVYQFQQYLPTDYVKSIETHGSFVQAHLVCSTSFERKMLDSNYLCASRAIQSKINSMKIYLLALVLIWLWIG